MVAGDKPVLVDVAQRLAHDRAQRAVRHGIIADVIFRHAQE